jgi:hypothetical protein
MKQNAACRIQFCDEYEELLGEFLRALAAWSQSREFRSQAGSAETREDARASRADQKYAAAVWALRMHSRNCVMCEETLRLHVNGGSAPAATLGAS